MEPALAYARKAYLMEYLTFVQILSARMAVRLVCDADRQSLDGPHS
jgi:hypothetical protein